MPQKIHINNLIEFIEGNNEKLVIIGQPKEVGVTTTMLEYFTQKCFFEENFNIIIFVENQPTKITCAQIIQNFLKENYDYNGIFDYALNYFNIFNNKLCILSYKNDEKCFFEVHENFLFDYAYFDKDENNKLANYYLSEYLPLISKQLLISTYDYPESIFYMDGLNENQKVIVYSEKSKQNILDLKLLPYYTTFYEEIIKGEFNEKKN